MRFLSEVSAETSLIELFDRSSVSSVLSVDSGEIVTNFYKFSLKSSEDWEWKYSFRGNSLPCGLYADSDKVISVCDNRVLALNASDGGFIGEYLYNGTLRDFTISENYTAIYYNDMSSNRNMLVSLDGAAQSVSAVQLSSNAQQLLLDGDTLYVLDGTSMKLFDIQTLGISDTVQMKSDYSSFVKIDSELFLLGYDVVDCERIN